MKYTKISSIFLITCLFTYPLYAFDTLAKQAIILDFDTEQILFDKNIDEKMPPSSMSKLMTLVILFDELKKSNLHLNDSFIVSKKAWKMTGSKMFLPLGVQVSIEDLIRGIIVHSGNDACIVVAEGISGSEEEFVTLLNEKANRIGLKNSHFTNSTGMPDSNHYMSAHDIAKLSQYIIKEFPNYYDKYFKETTFTYNNITQPNRNSLLNEKYHIDGLKTGHTDIAGYGISVSVKDNNRRLIIVTNGLRNHNIRHEETLKLLQYGILNFNSKEIAKKNEIVKEIPIEYAEKDMLKIGFSHDIKISALKNDLEDMKQEYILYNLQAPIKKGDHVGVLKITVGKNLYEYHLIALEDIKKASWFKCKLKDLKSMF